jgi:hypothetical protein
MIKTPIDGMRVQFCDVFLCATGDGVLEWASIDEERWRVRWDSGIVSDPFWWTEAVSKLFELADTTPTPISTEPMTDRERLLALRAREGRDGGYGFVT